MSPANITLENDSTVVDSNSYEPSIFISKYILSPATIFDFSFLNYTQYEPSRVDWGCGNLTYTPNFWTDPDDFRKDLVTISETDYEQENGLRF